MTIGFKHVFWASLAFISLLLLNFLLITLFSGSASYAISQLFKLKFYVVILALGFALQVMLVILMKDASRRSVLAMSGTATMNTGTMIACCAHHISDALPFLALGGLSAFLVNYQKELLLISIAINWLGVLFMFRKLKKLYGK